MQVLHEIPEEGPAEKIQTEEALPRRKRECMNTHTTRAQSTGKMSYLIHGEKSGGYCANTLEGECRQTRNNALEVQPTAHASKVIFDNTAVGKPPPLLSKPVGQNEDEPHLHTRWKLNQLIPPE